MVGLAAPTDESAAAAAAAAAAGAGAGTGCVWGPGRKLTNGTGPRAEPLHQGSANSAHARSSSAATPAALPVDGAPPQANAAATAAAAAAAGEASTGDVGEAVAADGAAPTPPGARVLAWPSLRSHSSSCALSTGGWRHTYAVGLLTARWQPCVMNASPRTPSKMRGLYSTCASTRRMAPVRFQHLTRHCCAASVSAADAAASLAACPLSSPDARSPSASSCCDAVLRTAARIAECISCRRSELVLQYLRASCSERSHRCAPRSCWNATRCGKSTNGRGGAGAAPGADAHCCSHHELIDAAPSPAPPHRACCMPAGCAHALPHATGKRDRPVTPSSIMRSASTSDAPKPHPSTSTAKSRAVLRKPSAMLRHAWWPCSSRWPSSVRATRSGPSSSASCCCCAAAAATAAATAAALPPPLRGLTGRSHPHCSSGSSTAMAASCAGSASSSGGSAARYTLCGA